MPFLVDEPKSVCFGQIGNKVRSKCTLLNTRLLLFMPTLSNQHKVMQAEVKMCENIDRKANYNVNVRDRVRHEDRLQLCNLKMYYALERPI